MIGPAARSGSWPLRHGRDSIQHRRLAETAPWEAQRVAEFADGVGVHRHGEFRVALAGRVDMPEPGRPPAAGLRTPHVPFRVVPPDRGHLRGRRLRIRRIRLLIVGLSGQRNEPAVRPETMRRWANRTSNAIGIDTMTTAASIRL